MIWATWQEPNFKFRATDLEGVVYEYFCFANSEAELRSRLETKNLTVASIVPYDFSEWRDRARKATEKAIQAHAEGTKPINFRSNIWAELKWHLFELFLGKCAYCESRTLHVA